MIDNTVLRSQNDVINSTHGIDEIGELCLFVFFFGDSYF